MVAMRTITTAAIGFAFLAVTACGGTSVSPGATCGAGTVLVNGQCVAAGSGGAAGGAGSDGSSGAVGAGGSSGNTGGNTAAGSAGQAADSGRDGPPLNDFCAGRDVVAMGSPGLVDDFEDHDIRVLVNDGRGGDWFLLGDGCTPAPTPLLPETPVAGMTVNNASKYAVHATGSACKTVTTGAAFNGYGDGVNGGECAYNASPYDGMYFWAIGAGIRVSVQVGLRTTMSMIAGGDGSCAQDATDKGCWDRHGVSMALTADWKEYSFTWSQLHQAGWGTRAAWDVRLTAEIVFSASSNDAASPNIDFSVDNVGFFKGTPPTDPPMPGQ